MAAAHARRAGRQPRPSLEDHTPEVEKLTQIVEALESLATIVRVKDTPAAATARPPQPHPRPETALSRFLDAKARAAADERDAEMAAGQQRWIERQRAKAAAGG